MRKTAKDKKSSLTVHAIPGVHVILFGLNMDKSETQGLLGFAVERTDHTENEKYFLRGFKTFKSAGSNQPDGAMVSTREHPIQSFIWGDYTAKAAHKYTYRFVALYGKPKNISEGHEVSVSVDTFDLADQSLPQIAIFNRGVAGSQAYSSKFGEVAPKDVPGNKAWEWLSNGLEESITGFIAQAKDKKWGLRCAFYEFQNHTVLAALRRAADTGADVKIIYDDRDNKSGPHTANDAAIHEAAIDDLCIPRTQNPSYISHNKFMVLLQNGNPVQVLMGSTNISDGGIYGHGNVAHIIRDKEVAQLYADYWDQLSADPTNADLKEWTDANSAQTPVKGKTVPLFSPRSDLSALELYAQMMDNSKGPVFFTAAFGINALLQDVLLKPKNYLRYVILETESSKAKENHLEDIKKDPNVRVAVGAALMDKHTRFLKESLTGLNVHVKYIHTKFMVLDPLGNDPTLITGSANFSDASTKNNDENMVIVKGNTDIIDIYLGEFMRLFNHFYARDWINKLGNNDAAAYLREDDSWVDPYFKKTDAKCKQREYFKMP